MMADFRALCAELTEKLDELNCLYKVPSQSALIERALDALAEADEPAVPEARAVLAEPKKPPNDVEIDALVHDCLEEDGYSLRVIVRAALARWGTPAPAPPADGEVAELTGQLIEAANGAAAMGWDQHAQRILRAAELLQRQALVPVSVSERLPGPEDMTEDGEVWVEDSGHDYPLADSGDYDWEPHKWILRPIGKFDAKNGMRWLPAHALPVPEVGE